jgi:hypothetical protein
MFVRTAACGLRQANGWENPANVFDVDGRLNAMSDLLSGKNTSKIVFFNIKAQKITAICVGCVFEPFAIAPLV